MMRSSLPKLGKHVVFGLFIAAIATTGVLVDRGSASAAVVTYDIEGIVTFGFDDVGIFGTIDEGVTMFSGTFSYDTDQGLYDDISLGVDTATYTSFSPDISPISLQIEINGNTITLGGGADASISVFDGGFEQFSLSGGDISELALLTESVILSLSGNTGAALSGTDPPGSLDLDDFNGFNYVELSFYDDETGDETFLELGITMMTSPDGPVVPEPASLVVWSLLGVLLTGGQWWRRRRRAAA